MSAPADRPRPPDRARRSIGWGLAGVMLLSFAGGILAFVPAGHRARKLAEMKQRYATKYSSRLRSAPAQRPDH